MFPETIVFVHNKVFQKNKKLGAGTETWHKLHVNSW